MSSEPVLQDVVARHRLVFSSCAAGTMLLLFDLLIRLDDEVELIWRSSNTPPKFLYFISRYFGLFVQIIYLTDVFPLYCPAQLYFRSAAYFILHVSVELSLMIRIYALWGQQRGVAIFLGSMWLGEQIINISITTAALSEMASYNTPYPESWPIVGCRVTYTPYFLSFCWLPVLFYETLLFAMNMYKCLSFRPLANTPLIVRVFRDGTIYYFLMCFILVVRIVSQFRGGSINGDIVDSWMTSTFSLAGSNLMLSIRKLAAERERKHLATPDISFGIPEFVTHPPAASHNNYDTVSSRSCKLNSPSEWDYEMQPLNNHTEIRVLPYRRSPSMLVSSDKGPPKLSLDLRLSWQKSLDSPRSPPEAVEATSPLAQRKASLDSSRSSWGAKDLSWLQDWETKL